MFEFLFLNFTSCSTGIGDIAATDNVTSRLENLEMSGNLTAVREGSIGKNCVRLFIANLMFGA